MSEPKGDPINERFRYPVRKGYHYCSFRFDLDENHYSSNYYYKTKEAKAEETAEYDKEFKERSERQAQEELEEKINKKTKKLFSWFE